MNNRTVAKRRARRNRKEASWKAVLEEQARIYTLRKQILQDIDLWEEVKDDRELFRGTFRYVNRVKVCCKTGAQQNDATARILKASKSFIEKRCIRISLFHCKMSFQEYVSVVYPLLLGLANSTANPPSDVDVDRVRTVADEILRSIPENEISGLALFELEKIAAQESSHDGRIFFWNQRLPDEGVFIAEIDSEVPEKRKVVLGNESRTVFRCPNLRFGAPERWISWDAGQLGLPGPSGCLPVYIQSHAIQRLFGPGGRIAVLCEESVAALRRLVSGSLACPTVIPSKQHSNSYLVSVGSGETKVGYFVAQVLPDCVIIRTFLLLTMDGTPEGDELRRKLRASRHDKAYLGWDCLENIVFTDIREDETIRAIFKECDSSGMK